MVLSLYESSWWPVGTQRDIPGAHIAFVCFVWVRTNSDFCFMRN